MDEDEPQPTPLTAEEAERILQQVGRGVLDTRDPEVRRIVAQAQRTIVRHSLWGDATSTRHRRYLFWGIAFLVLWIVGLVVPFAIVFGWFG